MAALFVAKVVRGADYRRIMSQGEKLSTPSFVFFYTFSFQHAFSINKKFTTMNGRQVIRAKSMENQHNVHIVIYNEHDVEVQQHQLLGYTTNSMLLKAGFIASKKLGNAVKRNRGKRLLRAIAQKVFYNNTITTSLHLCSIVEFVMIAKPPLLEREFILIRKEALYCLHQLRQKYTTNKLRVDNAV